MKSNYYAGLLILFGAYVTFISQASANESIHGTVSFLGTLPEHVSAEHGYSAQIRFRLNDSTCGADTKSKERWVVLVSGRMEGIYAHNDANFRNAFNLLTTSMLTGRRVQIDGAPSCKDDIVMNLYSSSIGLY